MTADLDGVVDGTVETKVGNGLKKPPAALPEQP